MSSDYTPRWAEAVRRHGEPDQWDTGVVRYPDEQPFRSPGPPPQQDPEHWITTAGSHRRSDQRPSRLVLWIGLALAVAVMAGAAFLVWMMRGQDSGVAACEAIASGKAADGSASTPGEKMTEREYQQVRGIFARSSDQDIRAHGTKLIDLAWQLQGSPDSALLVAGPMTEAYTGLAGACAARGHTIPPLGQS